MHSDLIGKIAKARQYAQEPERILLGNLTSRIVAMSFCEPRS